MSMSKTIALASIEQLERRLVTRSGPARVLALRCLVCTVSPWEALIAVLQTVDMVRMKCHVLCRTTTSQVSEQKRFGFIITHSLLAQHRVPSA